MIRVLGKGLTAQAIKDSLEDVVLYDDSDFDKYDLDSNEITIVSPGIPPYNKMVKSSKNIQSDYDLVYDEMPFSIWISGTNGKTTTTQMTQHLLECKGSVCGGNIGTPITKLDKDAPIWILETSSFTFYYTKRAKPNLYILLPITEDHITWHGSFEEYKQAKLKPLDMMVEGEIAIIPEEFKDYPTSAMKITYKNSDDLCSYFGIKKEKISFKEPFLLDALMALASKKIIFDEVDYERINSFKIDEHKVEEFFDKSSRLWIDDSKATNVDATINALVPYKDKKIYLILGGDDKGANLKPLFEYIKDLDVEVYAIGTNQERIFDFCMQNNIKILKCNILKNAVEEIAKTHDKNSVAILSPAAASLDQFSSYKQRGEEFKKFVFQLSLN
ncbi:UDP-N-acetylmuramoyl-L-alanine--D-glutamate ligase [Halarcobacter ebronensis]|uniref:UDP-N-acetylmuramoyl-L-alanine--D-glutamate ligase n=1 Tax=Halarcobacter ebronensis TaxID=1462615 RepID=A0A4Q1AM73_9BACT|nr:UDP-N-acetylmuramoyl-L-alanine--D-glutamate ligase [Halarcobacter ebronensis]QKF82995.1 UDP-N-acetylmuramoyl-L-alanine:D-glutamate ligase [Halarcobacter ebronensis]RXK02807.1 UDP-N-acetylmuramoyl-L-alanine--D-glutamate ligase [Halarcobacter ebronensis]